MSDCQRWRGGRQARVPANGTIRTADYEVFPLDAAEAKRFVSEHHYSGTCSSTAHPFGLGYRGAVVGTAVFGPPASMNAHRKIFPTLSTKEAVTLGRLVLLDEVPGNGESWFVSRCFELLGAPKLYRPLNKDGTPRSPIVAVESCADPVPRETRSGETIFRGHLGIVYQALNARYVGRTLPDTLRLLPDGTVFSKRASGKVGRGEQGRAYAAQQLEAWGADPLKLDEDPKEWLARWKALLTRPMRHSGNHRYLWSLSKRRRREVLGRFDAKPYPKNVLK